MSLRLWADELRVVRGCLAVSGMRDGALDRRLGAARWMCACDGGLIGAGPLLHWGEGLRGVSSGWFG
jgi:hypothetical protein